MMDLPSGQLDVGVQAERTTLAWQRTGTGVIVTGLLITRWCAVEDFPLWPGIALAGFSALAGLVFVRRRYHRILRTVSTGRTPMSRYLIPSAALLMVSVVLAVSAGVVLELMSPN